MVLDVSTIWRTASSASSCKSEHSLYDHGLATYDTGDQFDQTEEVMMNNLKLSANVFFTQTGWKGFEEKNSFA